MNRSRTWVLKTAPALFSFGLGGLYLVYIALCTFLPEAMGRPAPLLSFLSRGLALGIVVLLATAGLSALYVYLSPVADRDDTHPGEPR